MGDVSFGKKRGGCIYSNCLIIVHRNLLLKCLHAESFSFAVTKSKNLTPGPRTIWLICVFVMSNLPISTAVAALQGCH